jgi:curli biogenesis system outer membrane secretion channel CsgG
VQALEALPPRPLELRPVVTIYQFRSGTAQVPATAATDMFTEALVKSHQFRVVERVEVARDVMPEKQFNGAGQATGTVAQQQLRGAQYVFEGIVSEANAGEPQHQGGISIGGLNLGGSNNKDTIAIDVRILDAGTRDILDSVTARMEFKGTSAGLSGTGALLGTLAGLSGNPANPLAPDASYQASPNEGLDRALRACINAAVLQLVKSVPAGQRPASVSATQSPQSPQSP